MEPVTETLLLVLVVVTALGFDFTNGFHDTGNAMASSIATGALKPKMAVGLSAVLNLAGAFLSLTVAATIAKGLVDANAITLEVVLAGLIGGITWNLITWLLGMPSSSSHALIGGVVGSVLVAVGTQAVLWDGIVEKVILPAVVAPVVAIGVAATGTRLVAKITKGMEHDEMSRRFRWGQIGSASLISLAHGTNDAQKSMGIILLALISGGVVSKNASVPLWVIVSCAGAMAMGTYLGGWRVIRTLGKGITDIDSRQGMAADASSAAVILLSSHFGFSLSTTQVATGSILGSGVGLPGARVRWSVAGRMVISWLVTLPAAAVVGAACYGIQIGIGGAAGTVAVMALLLVVAGGIMLISRRKPVHAENVNDTWEGAGAVPVAASPATGTVGVTAATVSTSDAVVSGLTVADDDACEPVGPLAEAVEWVSTSAETVADAATDAVGKVAVVLAAGETPAGLVVPPPTDPDAPFPAAFPDSEAIAESNEQVDREDHHHRKGVPA